MNPCGRPITRMLKKKKTPITFNLIPKKLKAMRKWQLRSCKRAWFKCEEAPVAGKHPGTILAIVCWGCCSDWMQGHEYKSDTDIIGLQWTLESGQHDEASAVMLHSHCCLSETGITTTTQSSSSSSSPPNDSRLLFLIFFPDFPSFCSSSAFSPPSLFFFLLELAVMPWNLSSDERLAGFLKRILPSAGASSPVEEENLHQHNGGLKRHFYNLLFLDEGCQTCTSIIKRGHWYILNFFNLKANILNQPIKNQPQTNVDFTWIWNEQAYYHAIINFTGKININ